jgi:hypothetical protein
MKKLGVFFICGLVSVFLLAGIAAAKETVVVYTSLENEEVVEYLKVAKKELAELDIQAIRLSTGELGARMLAEKDNPQADCIWGWAVTNMSEPTCRNLFPRACWYLTNPRAGIRFRRTLRTLMGTGRPSIYMPPRWFRIPKYWNKKICRCPKAGMIS